MAEISVERNLVATFERTARRLGDRPMLWTKSEGAYRPMSWRTVAERARALGRALSSLGIAPGDRVGLVAENRPEWAIADLAIMQTGAITVPTYTTYTTEDHAYVLNHSGAKAVIFSGGKVAKPLVPAFEHAADLSLAIPLDPFEPPEPIERTRIVAFDEALEIGAEAKVVYDGAKELAPEDTACFIYTSGTGGTPKGVMLTHKSIQANIVGAMDMIFKEGGGFDKEVFLSFLPLSHSYEHTCGQFLPMAMGAEIYYAESVEKLSQNLVETRPTLVMCVPRLHEVLRQKILMGVERQDGTKAKLFHRAVALGKKRYERGLNPFERLVDMALDRLVRTKVRERFGGRVIGLISGGAPLAYDVGLFFHALGLPILQGYGQTETSPLVSVNVPSNQRLDTVGRPVKGVEVKIAEDGEILVRGDNVMKGYWRDEEATAASFEGEWLRTGDVGEIDENGFIRITDRKKDLIVNSGGDNISPQRVEGILGMEPEIGQVVVYGDRKPYLVALIVPDQDFASRFARENDASSDLAALVENKAFRDRIQEAIKRANERLSAIEKVRRFHLLADPFTVQNGLMTPTMKLRRPIIKQRCGHLLEDLYPKAAA